MSMNLRPLGHYELQELLGRGLHTEVWRAVDTQQRHYVTLKLFHPQSAVQADTDGMAPLLNEARAIAALHHANIVQMHDFQIAQPPEVVDITPYMVMDYVKGQTLANYIMNTSHMGRFPPPAEIVRLLYPISVAIDYAHQKNVVHHNIKPTNILLATSTYSSMPTPMLTDFGMMQLLQAVHWPERSASYVAPEQTQGYLDNKRSDLYCLGVILYELFTGTLPFEGDNPADTVTQHLNATPTPPSLINPNMLPTVTAVIMRSLAKDPASRYSSAGAMIASLARAVNVSLTEEAAQANKTDDTMNNPTYLIPGRSLGMTPSSPVLPTVGNWSVSPSSVVPPALSPIPPISSVPAGSSGQLFQVSPASPISPVSATPAGNASAAISSTDMDLPTVIHPLPFPVAQGREPITPKPPLYVPEPVATRPSTPLPGQAVLTPPGVVPMPTPAASPPQRHRRRPLFIALIALLIIVLLSSGIGSYFAFFAHGNTTGSVPPTIPIVGHAFFISSGLLSTNPESNQGITDQLQINMQKLPPPHAGKAYYAWLLNQTETNSDWFPIYLGQLMPRADGTASITFVGDASHTNLLASNSRFLITEEDASALPPTPSLDPSTWRYYAAFSQRPNLSDPKKFSLYDHLRHLLASDPNLSEVGLIGGLDIWLYRNTEKILEWSGSARDAWKNQSATSAAFIRRQLERVLAYLDSSTYYQKELPGQPLLVDQSIAKVALLEFDVQHQTPPGYLYHITKHLHEIAQLPDTAPEQKVLAIQIDEAIANVNTWLQAVHADALKLYKMTDGQLLGTDGRTLLDDLATQANNAFVGQIDPFTHQVKDGVVQIHYNIQRLATFDIRACTSSDPCSV